MDVGTGVTAHDGVSGTMFSNVNMVEVSVVGL